MASDYAHLMRDYARPNPAPGDVAEGGLAGGDGTEEGKEEKPKYALGEIAHTPRDMVVHRSNEKAIEAASMLQKHEQAFLKRSNGVW